MIENLIIVSDLHCGCRYALCPPEVELKEGKYKASEYQKIIWGHWKSFWEKFVPVETKEEDFALLINGDIVDGSHHGSSTQISHNIYTQREIALTVLNPIVSNPKCKKIFVTAGTEVHAGESGRDDETIAKEIGAIPLGNNYARNEVLIRMGDKLIHASHHISAVGSNSFETTALNKEYSVSCEEAGRWGLEAPDVIIRSHRHRHSEVRLPTKHGDAVIFSTAGWQLKTPWIWKHNRFGIPQIGGSIVRYKKKYGIWTRHYTVSIANNKKQHIEIL